jgi:hypothetical protein
MQITPNTIKHVEEQYILEDSNGKYLLYGNMMPVFLDEIVELLDAVKINRIVIEAHSTDVQRGIFELYNNGWRLTGTNTRIQSDTFGKTEHKGLVFEKDNGN